jgi:hypothetical protein
MASERMLIDPLITPTISFKIMRKEFEMIDNRAILTFLFIHTVLYKNKTFREIYETLNCHLFLWNYLPLLCNKPAEYEKKYTAVFNTCSFRNHCFRTTKPGTLENGTLAEC